MIDILPFMPGHELKFQLKLDEEFTPLLLHEYTFIQARNQANVARNNELAKQMAEAVGPSDWHDNPAYEAVREEMEKLDQVSETLGPLALLGEPVRYPSAREAGVSMGSRVTLDMQGDVFNADIVGQNSFLDKDNADPEVECTSVRSPLGFALLGATMDSVVNYVSESGLEIVVTVVAIDQLAQVQAYWPNPNTLRI